MRRGLHNFSTDPKRFIQERITRVDGHWLWKGRITDKGYGRCEVRYKNKRIIIAHRLSWIAYKGPIPNHLHILHKCICIYKYCVRPNHLYQGTEKQNTNDAIIMGRKSYWGINVIDYYKKRI